jgi:hypothetical protein
MLSKEQIEKVLDDLEYNMFSGRGLCGDLDGVRDQAILAISQEAELAILRKRNVPMKPVDLPQGDYCGSISDLIWLREYYPEKQKKYFDLAIACLKYCKYKLKGNGDTP